MEDDYYAILGVPEDATPKQIKKAYYEKALIHHPDKLQNKDKPDAATIFLKISKAHEILMDETKKAAYDSTLKAKKLKKRKEMEMDASRKKMKDDLIRRENEERDRKEEIRRNAKAPKYAEDDTSWLKRDKPFRMPSQPAPPPQPAEDTQRTTIVAKWSRKKQFSRDEIMEAFKKFGDIDLVMLKDVRDSGKGRPSALISFRLASSAQSAVNAKHEDFRVRWSSKEASASTTTPTPPPQRTNPTTPQSPFTFTSPFGQGFSSPAGSPFAFASPQGAFFSPSQTNRSVEELEDYEMQILNKMKKAAQAQREATPTSTPTATPDKNLPKPTDFASYTPSPSPGGPNPSPAPSPNHSFSSFSPSPSPSKFETPNKAHKPIDVDNPTATNPIIVDAPATPTPVIDLDAAGQSTPKHSTPTQPTTSSPFMSPPQGNLDFESVAMMKLRQAAERKKLLEDLEKSSM